MLDGVSLNYGETTILDHISLDVADGELMAIIGPSGSGKTTILRVVAGLDEPSSGAVLIGGRDVTTVPTRDRDVAMVFQEAVLFPFMRAKGNVGFPLRVRDVPAPEIADRVQAEGRALEIEEIMDRWPRQLSAGHQQLVQVAKAMIRVPSVFLLDEPLARVGAGQRTRLRGELRSLQRGYGVTTVYVTNDPTEAMAIADRLMVINDGHVEQVGKPLDVYRRPVSRFVGEFVGSRPMSVLDVVVESDSAGSWLVGQGFRVRAWPPELEARVGESLWLGVRLEDVELDPAGEVDARVTTVEAHGAHSELALDVGGSVVWARGPVAAPPPGDAVRLRFVRWHLYSRIDGRAVFHLD